MAQPPQLLTPAQVAERSGLAVSALHFYEREGLIRSSRTAGNQRRYRRDVLRRLALVRMAQRVGIPLAEVREALDRLPVDRSPTRRDWQRLGAAWRAELDARIHRLQQLRDDFDGCIGCGCLSLRRCSVYNAGDRLSAEGPGPRRLERHRDERTGPEGGLPALESEGRTGPHHVTVE